MLKLPSVVSNKLANVRSCVRQIPCGLVVRIRRSHRRGRGSIPRMGALFIFFSPSFFPFFSGKPAAKGAETVKTDTEVCHDSPELQLLDSILKKAQKIKLSDEVIMLLTIL